MKMITTSRTIFAIFVVLALFSAGVASGEESRNAVCSGNEVRLRGVPSEHGDILDVLNKNDRLKVLKEDSRVVEIEGTSNRWYKVQAVSSGKVGWVFGAYVEFEQSGAGTTSFRVFQKIGLLNPRRVALDPAGGIYVTHPFEVSVSRDAGNSWNTILPSMLGTKIGEITSIHVVDGKTFYLTALGESGGGLWKSGDGGSSWTRFSTLSGLVSNDAYDVAFDPQNSSRIRVATKKGIAWSDDAGVSWKKWDDDDDLPSDSVFAVDQDSAGTLWAGTEKGVAYLKQGKKEFEVAGEWREIRKMRVTILHARSGSVWAGGPTGLVHILSPSAKPLLLGGAGVNAVTVFDKMVFVATRNGISYSPDGGMGWQSIGVAQGLPSANVLDLAYDSQRKTIWAVTNGGLARLSL